MNQAPPPTGDKKQKPILPPLRNDISFAFNDYDLEGKPQWMIHDPSRNKFFLIGWLEYEIISRWHLGDPEKIITSIQNETTLQVEMQDIENFLNYLTTHFLIKQSGYKIHSSAKQQKMFEGDNRLKWIIEHYLFFRIPLCQPDGFLSRTKWFGDLLFSRYTAYIMIVLAGLAIFQLGARWDVFLHTFSSIFTWQGILFYLIAFLFCKLIHELGHAYKCKSYGVPVPTLGVAFLVFWPVLYTDTTLSWTLNSKQRMKIALAGVWAESYITIIAALIWCNSDNLTLKSICYLVITVNWIASLLINVSPFMRFDGYYVLADFLRMPNLQPRAFALTRWQIRRWLFHWPTPPPEKFKPSMHAFLVAYSITTWIYRFIIYLAIAILVYLFFFKMLGIILFAVELYYFIISPVLTEIRFWLSSRENFSFNLRTRITTFLVVVILLFFLLPVSETLKMPATVSYAHEFISAPEEGILATPLPKTGSIIKKGETIVIISSPMLNQEIKEVKLNYQKTLDELRQTEIDPSLNDQKSILLSAASRERSKYEKLMERFNRLTIKAPFTGVIAEVASDIKLGTSIMNNEWLGDLIDPEQILIEAYVSQIDRARIKTGLKGYFYSANLEQAPLPVKVKTIEILNTRQLDCHFSGALKAGKVESTTINTPCYHISDLGGEIPTLLTNEGTFVPVDSVYRVILETPEKVKFSRIERGSVILDSEPSSFASRTLYQVKKIWIEQSGF